MADYKLERVANGVTVTDLHGDGGTDTLVDVERVLFDGKLVVFAGLDSPEAEVIRLYQAAFGRTPEERGLSAWTSVLEWRGVGLDVVAGEFVQSKEYQDLYGADRSNHDLVAKYYEHILHRAADDSGLAFWIGLLDSHTASEAQVLAAISESPESVALSAALIGNGIVMDW